MTVAARPGFWLAGLVMVRSCWNVGCEGLHCYPAVIDIPRTHSTLAQNHPAGETLYFTVGQNTMSPDPSRCLEWARLPAVVHTCCSKFACSNRMK
jgi:hypothetical protein